MSAHADPRPSVPAHSARPDSAQPDSARPDSGGARFPWRCVGITFAGWLLAHALLLALANHLPFHATALSSPPTLTAVLRTDAMLVEVFVLMVVAHLITRRRPRPDLAARAPNHARARAETWAVLGYGLLAMAGGLFLGHAFGWHAFSFHLDGMVIRTGQPVVPAEAITWAGYNLLVFAILPYLVFRRRCTAVQLNLRSADRRADLVLVVVVLCLESAVQLAVAHPSILDLSLRQTLLAAPLTFVLSLAGTVLPTMVFVYCILTPRYLRLTGSVPVTIVLGGLTYAALHFFDGWTTFANPIDALMSGLFVALFYLGPGMFKTFLTVRTGNAWVHVWAYHAIAPHVLIDTPMITDIFGI